MMFGSRRKQSEQLLARMERQLDLIHTALVVRDPGTAVSVEAYEGLRKQVIAGATARQAHVAQLAEFDVALHRGATPEDLRSLAKQWLDQAGVTRVEDAALREAFESTVAPDQEAVVDVPAYVIAVTGQLVRQGRLLAVAMAPIEAEMDVEESASETIGSVTATPASDAAQTADNVKAYVPQVERGLQVDLWR